MPARTYQEAPFGVAFACLHYRAQRTLSPSLSLAAKERSFPPCRESQPCPGSASSSLLRFSRGRRRRERSSSPEQYTSAPPLSRQVEHPRSFQTFPPRDGN